MTRTALFYPIVIGALALSPDLPAAQMHTADGGAPFRLGWREAPLSSSPFEKFTAEPIYKSDHVLYMALRLGNGDDGIITGVLDESQGSGKGYDTLYLDANNNGDLTDDSVIKPRVERAGSATSLNIEPLDVLVKYAGATQRTLRVKLEIRKGTQQKGETGDISWSVGYQLEQHLEGKINIGDRKDVLIGIFDSSRDQHESNGCFDDYGVDRIRIDLNGDGKLDAKTEDFPLSRAINVDGKLWQVELSSAVSDMDLKPCSLPAGKIQYGFTLAKKARVDSGSIEIFSDEGYGFVCALPGRNGFTVPEGTYRISSGSVVLVDGAGKKWSALFAGRKEGALFTHVAKSLIVKNAESTTIALGGPFKMGLTCKGSLTPGCEVCIEPVLVGAAGEVYENIALTGTRMTPHVKIIDAEKIVLAESNMDYG
jgi:hypothetical protein